MTTPRRPPALALLVVQAALAAACSPFAQTLPRDEPARCTRTALEEDFYGAPWAGPGVTNGAVRAGSYVIASTYLRIKPELLGAQSTFGGDFGAIRDALPTQPGLVAYRFGISNECITARTLTVWESEEAMMGFVTGAEHQQAMRDTNTISRGGSVTVRFTGDASVATWERALTELGAVVGPVY